MGERESVRDEKGRKTKEETEGREGKERRGKRGEIKRGDYRRAGHVICISLKGYMLNVDDVSRL